MKSRPLQWCSWSEGGERWGGRLTHPISSAKIPPRWVLGRSTDDAFVAWQKYTVLPRSWWDEDERWGGVVGGWGAGVGRVGG